MITENQITEMLPAIRTLMSGTEVNDVAAAHVLYLMLKEATDRNDTAARQELKKAEMSAQQKMAVQGNKHYPSGVYVENRWGEVYGKDYFLDVSVGVYPQVAQKTFLRNGEGILIGHPEIMIKQTYILKSAG